MKNSLNAQVVIAPNCWAGEKLFIKGVQRKLLLQKPRLRLRKDAFSQKARK
jgi:hypothetical protein